MVRCLARPSTSTTTRPRPSIRACSRRCCRSSPRSSATRPRPATRGAGRRRRPSRRRAARWPRSSARRPREIVFTSGATESNNFAIHGVRRAPPDGRRHIVVSAIEHKSVLESAKRLEAARLARARSLPVDARRPASISTALDAARDARHGARQRDGAPTTRSAPSSRSPRSARSRTRAARSSTSTRRRPPARSRSTSRRCSIDLLSLTGHKMYGPKGCGAIFIRKTTELAPLIVGGGQERGLRSGTLNVPGIVGLGQGVRDLPRGDARRGRAAGAVCAIACSPDLRAQSRRHHRQRIDRRTGCRTICTSVSTASMASRCSSASATSRCRRDRRARRPRATPSHVLRALLGATHVPSASIRFGLGRFTTDDEIDYTIEKFTDGRSDHASTSIPSDA